ncbi:MAG TPA: hypothetical protein VKM55_24830 [Candidatus Lokiarchaeia archaeon]|nr:hypothetical protein [Candidatus Lokiarchaeia archaeon]
MAFSNNYNRSYTAAGLVGYDYSIRLASNSRLIVDFRIDQSLLRKRMMMPFIIMGIVFAAVFIPLFGGLFFTFGRSPYFDIGAFSPLLIYIVAMIVCFGVLIGGLAVQVKRWQAFQLVLDKVTNKMTLYAQNPFIRGRYANRYYSRLGHYLASAWDLDKIMFRLVMPGERAGPGMTSFRIFLKNSCLVMYGNSDLNGTNILLASKNAEIARSLMGEIDAFFRGDASFKSDTDDNSSFSVGSPFR